MKEAKGADGAQPGLTGDRNPRRGTRLRVVPGGRYPASPAAPGNQGPPRGGPRTRPAARQLRAGVPGAPARRDGRGRRPGRSTRSWRRSARASWIAAARGDPGRRLGVSLLCIAVTLSLFAGRLVQLQGLDAGKYRSLASQLRLHTFHFPALRGTITAANGQVLAMTVQTYLVFADPVEMTAQQMPRVASALAGPLGMTPGAILNLIRHPTSPQYVVLKRGVPQQAGNQIAALSLPGIAMTPGYARSYPDGGAVSNLLGFTSTDASGNLVGEAGIERADNSMLAGRPGFEQAQVSTGGQPIPFAVGKDTPAVNGSDLRLTIIPALQWKAQQACAARVKETNADNCTVVIMQPHTGRILAMAQWPAYNPAHPSGTASTSDLPLEDVFEPGSTAKVITLSAALERGGQTPDSVYTIPYQITWHGFHFHDWAYHPVEKLTINGILANSSNVGMVQVAQHISPQTQYAYFRAFGVGEPTGIGLPGDTPGLLAPPSKWWGDQRYTLAFGQGVAVNAVQMASVYATIANGGVRVQPTLVEGTTNGAGHYTPAPASPSRRVIMAKTARELIAALQQVPEVDAKGGQPWGIIPGYAVASKTGTAQEWDSQAKCLCMYGASYIGMAPGNDPQVVVAVNVQNPRKGEYGSVVAGPVFNQVMKFALQTMKIPPDGATPAHVPLTAP